MQDNMISTITPNVKCENSTSIICQSTENIKQQSNKDTTDDFNNNP